MIVHEPATAQVRYGPKADARLVEHNRAFGNERTARPRRMNGMDAKNRGQNPLLSAAATYS
jgi:hypothetical protein